MHASRCTLVPHPRRLDGFVPVQPLQTLNTGEFARIARNQRGLMAQYRGGYQGIVRADGRARGLKLGANTGGMGRAFAIERQDLHRSQQSGQCHQTGIGCLRRQTQKAVAKFVFHYGGHADIGGERTCRRGTTSGSPRK